MVRKLATAVMAGGLLMSTSTTAFADSWAPIVVKDPDTLVWKAYESYIDSDNLVCIRAYNSVSSAYAETWIRDYWGDPIVHFRDYGGDDQPSCRSISYTRDGEQARIFLQHVSSTGSITGYVEATRIF